MSFATLQRHKSVAVAVGGVAVGGGAPIVVQSMTNTDTADVEGTARQVAALAVAGAEQILRREVDAKVHADLLASVQHQL